MSRRSERLPVVRAMDRQPVAAATARPCSMVAFQALWLYGRTVPCVPRMEMPPTMPSRGLNVCRASRSPSGTLIITRKGGHGDQTDATA